MPEADKACRLILAEVEQFYTRYANLNAEQLGLMQDRLLEELQTLCGGDTIVFTLGEGRYGLCLYGKEAALEQECGDLVRSIARLPKSEDRLICYDGGQARHPDEIRGLYETAMHAREARFSPTEERKVDSIASTDDRLDSAVNAVLDAVRLGDDMLLK